MCGFITHAYGQEAIPLLFLFESQIHRPLHEELIISVYCSINDV